MKSSTPLRRSRTTTARFTSAREVLEGWEQCGHRIVTCTSALSDCRKNCLQRSGHLVFLGRRAPSRGSRLRLERITHSGLNQRDRHHLRNALAAGAVSARTEEDLRTGVETQHALPNAHAQVRARHWCTACR